jgi:phospholipase C
MPDGIQHVLVLMLENRSFDHLLAFSGIAGLTGVDTSKTNPGASGEVPMSDAAPDRLASDPGHEFEDVDWQIYGSERGSADRVASMNGFANRGWPDAMQCASSDRVPVLTHLARQFLVCDQWFASMPGPTWPNRFFVHAASSGGLANSPANLSTLGSVLSSELGFSFSNGSLYDRLEAAGRKWRVYHGDHFPQVCAIDRMPSVFVADPDSFRPLEQFAADMAQGDVADYTFLEPDYDILSTFRNGNSQHPSGSLSAGEQLIHAVASAAMHSPVWQSSVLFILYDEHGGFFDQIVPPACTPPGDAPLNADKAQNPPDPAFGFDRYGVRVPAVIVSPRVTPGVCHEVLDHSCVIRTVFELFGLPGSLTARDAGAISLAARLEGPVQTAAPAALPAPNEPPPPVPPPVGDSVRAHSIDGFARIAAEVHHALTKYQPGIAPEVLHRAVQASPDLSPLPELPKTPRQDESRAYIAKVAALMQAHRARQRATRRRP